MSTFSILNLTWQTIKEIDLEPFRNEAMAGVRLAMVGTLGSGRKTLVERLRNDPLHGQMVTDTPVWIYDLQNAAGASEADLIILVLDSRRNEFNREAELSRIWSGAGKSVLVLINQFDQSEVSPALKSWIDWKSRRVVTGSILDERFLTGSFSKAAIDLIPNKLLALARYFPLFRAPVAHHLINEACLTNVTYSFSTGIAEIVPVLNIPLAVTDMFVLSKNQAFMVYKIGLALGMSTRWQDYLAEFGSVLGSGFVWRQIARTLVSLVPLWGILPKVSISYAGTYVIGQAVLQWYLTGRHISRQQMRVIYNRALGRGRELGRKLLHIRPRWRLPHPRLPSRRRSVSKRQKLQKPTELKSSEAKLCHSCGQSNAGEARFCQFCGFKFQDVELTAVN